MDILSRVKSAWGALWGDSQGFVPLASGGLLNPIAASGSDDPWLRISAYFACIRNISEDIAKLPLITYRRLPRGKERAVDHPLYNLLRRQPHPSIGSMAFRETTTRFALGLGNGFAQILRKVNGEPYALQPINPSAVEIKPGIDGHVEYLVRQPNNDLTISDSDMIHLHGLSADGICGISIAGLARENLEFAGSAQSFGRNLFASGGRPGGILKHPAKLSKEAKESLGKSWEAAYGGKNTGKTAILDHGIEYQAIAISPVDAQFLETRQFSCEEIARWFRMPLHKIQYLVRAQGWSTLDAQNTDYLTDCLMPWLVRWEDELNRKLFPDSDEYFVEHLVNGMLRGDLATRSAYYVSQFSIGHLSINEIRELENENIVDDEMCDKHFIPMNMTPAEFIKSVSAEPSAAAKPQEEKQNA